MSNPKYVTESSITYVLRLSLVLSIVLNGLGPGILTGGFVATKKEHTQTQVRKSWDQMGSATAQA